MPWFDPDLILDRPFESLAVAGILVVLALLAALKIRAWVELVLLMRSTVVGRYDGGTVYVMALRENPRIVKVGTTTRLTSTRKAEIEAEVGLALRIVYAIDRLPYAWGVEQTAHRILARRRLRWGNRREWFISKLDGDKEAADIVASVDRAVRRVRQEAGKQGRWSREMDAAPKFWRWSNGTESRGSVF